MNLSELLQRCCDNKLIVSMVGGGGKTTTMYWIAGQCAARGKRVLVTTTTHIGRPEKYYAETAEQVRNLWHQKRYAVIGKPEGPKLIFPDQALYDELAAEADLVLIEADGAKRLPVKIPNATEPVITADTGLVIGAIGISALGQKLADICFRYESDGAWLEEGPDAVLDERIAAKILASERGSRQYVGDRDFIALLNQCDNDERIARAKVIEAELETKGIPVIISSGYRRRMNQPIVVKGGGDVATGTIRALWRQGYPVIVLEAERPSAVRRMVSVSEAVFDRVTTVEGMKAVLIEKPEEAYELLERGIVPVLVDPEGKSLAEFKPWALIDATLAKHVITTTMDMAPLVIGLGPGFEAGRNAHYVVETNRGEELGRIISEGLPMANTGVPGEVGGYTLERVLRAPEAGVFRTIREIGEPCTAGEVVAYIEGLDGERHDVVTQIDGFLRGFLRDGHQVIKGFKVGDVDPRTEELANCGRITDKSNKIGGSVLELIQGHDL